MNKTALVTGGARRLGKDISMVVAEAGFDIVLNYNSTPQQAVDKAIEQISAKGVKVYPIKANVGNVTEIGRMFKK